MKKINKITRSIKRILTTVILLVTFTLTIYLCTDSYVSGAKDTEISRLNEIVEEYKTKADTAEYENSKGIIKTIVDVCEEEGIDPEIALSVAVCESYLNPFFVGVNKNKTVDRGIFGINNHFYSQVSDECAFSVDCSTRIFAEEMKAGRLKNWICARTLNLLSEKNN